MVSQNQVCSQINLHYLITTRTVPNWYKCSAVPVKKTFQDKLTFKLHREYVNVLGKFSHIHKGTLLKHFQFSNNLQFYFHDQQLSNKCGCCRSFCRKILFSWKVSLFFLIFTRLLLMPPTILRPNVLKHILCYFSWQLI